MRRLGIMTVALAIGAATAAPAPAQRAEATIDRAVAAYARVRTLRATFEQTLVNPLTNSTLVSRGEVVQQRPDRLLVRFTDPSGDRIVADGKAVWIYLPSTAPGQVMKLRPGTGTAGGVDVTAQFLDAPKERYTITDGGAATIDGRPARLLILVPKVELPFTRARVWVDDADGLVRRFEVTDASGIVRQVRLTSLRLNGPVKASLFAFTPPKGVRVFDQTGGGGR